MFWKKKILYSSYSLLIIMYRFSFKVKHKNCAETGLSLAFPKHHITVVDIQSSGTKKQYFYYITGKNKDFDVIFMRTLSISTKSKKK